MRGWAVRWCRVCGVAENLNPTDDHENWTGHPWEPMEGPGPRRRLTQAEWEAELARARGVQAMDVDRLITRTPRKRSRWGRPWERKR